MTARNLAKLLGLIEQAKQLAQDIDPNNDRLLRFLSQITIASEVYEPLHRELAQKSRQALISAYFLKQHSRAPAVNNSDAGVEEQALEEQDIDDPMSDSDDEVASIISEINFDGF